MKVGRVLSWAPKSLIPILPSGTGINSIKGLAQGNRFLSPVFTHSWVTWPRSMMWSAAWPAVPTAPSTIPQLSSRPAGSYMLLQPWISPDAILPFTEVWASCLLYVRPSTTPSGLMVSPTVTPISHLMCLWCLVTWCSKSNCHSF